jgi:hypothetical protein
MNLVFRIQSCPFQLRNIQRRREGQPIPFWVRFESFFSVREVKKGEDFFVLREDKKREDFIEGEE